jgi:hypothetical protein
MNPRWTVQKVAVGTISGLPKTYKFHFKDIPEHWFKVDVREALRSKTALIYPNDDADQSIVRDVVGTAALWEEKYIKIAM